MALTKFRGQLRRGVHSSVASCHSMLIISGRPERKSVSQFPAERHQLVSLPGAAPYRRAVVTGRVGFYFVAMRGMALGGGAAADEITNVSSQTLCVSPRADAGGTALCPSIGAASLVAISRASAGRTAPPDHLADDVRCLDVGRCRSRRRRPHRLAGGARSSSATRTLMGADCTPLGASANPDGATWPVAIACITATTLPV